METPASSTKQHFHEHWRFKALVAIVGLAAALWGLVGAPTPWQAATELTATSLPLKNTQIILDASARMGEPFGGATKLEIAAEAVGQYAVAGESVGLALRRVGGECEDGDLLVDFDSGQSEAVRKAAEEQRPAGRSNLAYAVRAAIGEFAEERFQNPNADNQIVVFVGGGDQCSDVPGWEILNELRDANVQASFQFFALKASKKALKGLDKLKRQLKPVADVEIRKAKNVEQLYRAVREESEEAVARPSPSGAGEDRTANDRLDPREDSPLRNEAQESQAGDLSGEGEEGETELEEGSEEEAEGEEREEAGEEEKEEEAVGEGEEGEGSEAESVQPNESADPNEKPEASTSPGSLPQQGRRLPFPEGISGRVQRGGLAPIPPLTLKAT